MNDITAKYRTETGASLLDKSKGGTPPAPKSKKEYDALPSGTRYLHPDGTIKTKK